MTIKGIKKEEKMHEPFFSFLLITYNQEKFIEEAFASLVKQSFLDYEIVICDDCSSDSTFERCVKLVEEYRRDGGLLPITLHRNERNMGIGGNFQQAAQLSHGIWLVMAAGDDISLPTRLETLSYAIHLHPNAYGINTARYFVDEKADNPIYNFQKDYLLGADSAWHRSLFADFIPLDRRVMSEDHILNLRAMLKGEMLQVNTPTILYRVSSQNYSMQKSTGLLESKKTALRKMEYHRSLLEFRLNDLNFWAASHDEPLLPMIVKKTQEELREVEMKIASYDLYVRTMQANFSQRMMYLFRPTKVWLHNSIISRLYNLAKMYGLLGIKPRRPEKCLPVEKGPDNRTETITLSDFVDVNRDLF